MPTYARAAAQFLFDANHALMRAKDPILSQMKVEVVDTLPPSRVTLDTGMTVESPNIEVTSAFTLGVPDMIDGRFESLYPALDEAAEQALRTLMPAFYQHVSHVTEAAGQTIEAGGRPFIEVMIETIDKMDVNFDEEDKPTFSIVMHPDMMEEIRAQGEPSPEAMARLQEVIERKRFEYHRRRDTRRLS